MRALRPWRVRVLWRSSPRRSLRVQKIDSMCWRIGARCGPCPGSSLRAGLSIMRAVLFGDGGGEFAADVALVGDDSSPPCRPIGEQSERDLAFFLVSGSEDRRSGGAVRGGEQVQAHAPEPAGMAAAVPVAAGVGEL